MALVQVFANDAQQVRGFLSLVQVGSCQSCSQMLRGCLKRDNRCDDARCGKADRHHSIARFIRRSLGASVHTRNYASTIFIRNNSSATCTAFSAAPLRSVSVAHQKASPCGTVRSRRRRLTKTASSPAVSAGVT